MSNNTQALTRNRVIWLALSLAVLITSMLIALAWIPIPQQQHYQNGDTVVTFSLNRSFVPFRETCVQYQWESENIQTIHWNGKGTVGSRNPIYCDHTRAATLTVTIPDETTVDFVLQPTILIENRVAQSAAGIALVLYIVAMVVFVGQRVISGVGQQSAIGMLRIVEIAVIWIVITFALLEIGTRLLVRFTVPEVERLAYVGSAEEIQQAKQAFVNVPFLGYTLSPNSPTSEDTINAMGFRGDPISVDKPTGTYRILALGGSTTYGYNIIDERTWPARLQSILREDYGYENIEVINGGVPNYNTWHSYINFSFRGLELDPDLVIVYHAINDAIIMNSVPPGCWRGENLSLGLGAAIDVMSSAAPQSTLPRSAFQRYMAINLGWMENPMIINPFRSARSTTEHLCANAESSSEITANSPHYFERNIRNLIAVAEANDVDVMLSTWASYWSQGEPSGVDYIDTTLTLNDVIREIADSTGVYLVDLARDLEFEPYFWGPDGIHQTDEGTIMQARIYADAIDKLELITNTDSD